MKFQRVYMIYGLKLMSNTDKNRSKGLQNTASNDSEIRSAEGISSLKERKRITNKSGRKHISGCKNNNEVKKSLGEEDRESKQCHNHSYHIQIQTQHNSAKICI